MLTILIGIIYRQVDPETLKMVPRCLLVGHTAPILCISKASIIKDNNFIVSSSEAGEMCTWDLVDGKCREVVKLQYVHTSVQVCINLHIIRIIPVNSSIVIFRLIICVIVKM